MVKRIVHNIIDDTKMGTNEISVKGIREMLVSVADPEIPVLSVLEMGIIRDIGIVGNEVTVIITPTYSGCPAMHVIEGNIRECLMENGISDVVIKTVFSPAWTTDWLSDSAKAKLQEYGIAPPHSVTGSPLLHIEIPRVQCPYCRSLETEVKSEFGSTACKSYYYCTACRQPFEYFKPF